MYSTYNHLSDMRTNYPVIIATHPHSLTLGFSVTIPILLCVLQHCTDEYERATNIPHSTFVWYLRHFRARESTTLSASLRTAMGATPSPTSNKLSKRSSSSPSVKTTGMISVNDKELQISNLCYSSHVE